MNSHSELSSNPDQKLVKNQDFSIGDTSFGNNQTRAKLLHHKFQSFGPGSFRLADDSSMHQITLGDIHEPGTVVE